MRAYYWSTLPPALLALFLLPASGGAQAPERAPAWFGGGAVNVGASTFLPVDLTEETMAPASTGISRSLIGAALGFPAGVLTGAAVGYLVGPRDDVSDGCMAFCVPTGPAIGIMIGAAIGPGIGAHLLNDRRGSLGWAVVGSVLGTFGSLGAGYLLGTATGSTAVGLGVAIPFAVGVPALAEWVTGNR